MARWTYPDNVAGFAIGDAEGFGLLASKIEEFVGPMRPELRLPLYIDFEGAATKTFKLPKGHVGVVVLDPTGAVVYRHSGKMEPAEIEKLRGLLGASLPTPTPAPAFKVGELDNAACAGRTPSSSAARTKVSGAGFPASFSSRMVTPSTRSST